MLAVWNRRLIGLWSLVVQSCRSLIGSHPNRCQFDVLSNLHGSATLTPEIVKSGFWEVRMKWWWWSFCKPGTFVGKCTNKTCTGKSQQDKLQLHGACDGVYGIFQHAVVDAFWLHCCLSSGEVHRRMHRRDQAGTEAGESVCQGQCCQQIDIRKSTQVRSKLSVWFTRSCVFGPVEFTWLVFSSAANVGVRYQLGIFQHYRSHELHKIHVQSEFQWKLKPPRPCRQGRTSCFGDFFFFWKESKNTGKSSKINWVKRTTCEAVSFLSRSMTFAIFINREARWCWFRPIAERNLLSCFWNQWRNGPAKGWNQVILVLSEYSRCTLVFAGWNFVSLDPLLKKNCVTALRLSGCIPVLSRRHRCSDADDKHDPQGTHTIELFVRAWDDWIAHGAGISSLWFSFSHRILEARTCTMLALRWTDFRASSLLT